MPTYFVGPGGNDANSGLTWALRKLTLNGAEDVPVVAGDIVIVGPGVYRELLVCDVSGGAGNRITYIADVTGEDTDGVGGLVRITGSDNDQTIARVRVIDGLVRDYRTFRGFWLNLSSAELLRLNGSENWIIEDCVFGDSDSRGILGANAVTNTIIRRCLFFSLEVGGITMFSGAGISDQNILIENCIFLGGGWFTAGCRSERVGGWTIQNCLFYSLYYGVRVHAVLPVGQTIVVNNCIFESNREPLSANAVGEIVEDFNTLFNNFIDRTNTAIGANSITFPAILLPPVLHSGASQISGFKYPWWVGELSEFSQVRAIAGVNEPGEDFRGVIRPATVAKNSWGALQFHDMEREIGTVRTGVSSMVLLDAGINQMFIPITAEEITVEVYVQREAAYAGVNPQMIIKQPGQADRVTLDAGAAGAWNLLTDTFTPAALPPYVIVEFVSNNTAVAGAFSTFFDDLEVS